MPGNFSEWLTMNATLEIGRGLQASPPTQNVPWWRKARSLKIEIALAFGIVIALMLALGLTFYLSDRRSAEALDKLNSDARMADLTLRGELAMAKAADYESDFLLSADTIGVTASREQHLLPMQAQVSEAREYLANVRIISSDPGFRDQISRIDQQVRQFEESVLAVANVLGTTRQIETPHQSERRFDAVAQVIESALEDLNTAASKRAIETRNGVEHAANIARWTIFTTVALAILLGVIVALIVWRRINGSVSQLIAFAGRVAAGDFSARAPQGSEHEFAVLARAMNQMAQSLENSQTQLLASARQAGMAEIATNVLHNVGNILNSVNVSASLVSSTLRSSKAQDLSRGVQLMNEHAGDLGDYLTRDDKGRLLPGYLTGFTQALEQEQHGMIEELNNLTRSVDHIKDVVATQQSYAVGTSVIEPVQICDLAEDALRMNGDALARHQVTVVREFAPVPVMRLDRARVLQILVNLISNAKNAMQDMQDASRRLTLRVDVAAGSRLRVQVKDEGEGIPVQNLTRIFAHGFTTRMSGHGFGLHSCALAAQQMGGTLTAHSDGPGRGATFTLELPIDTARNTK
jgi:signal transduction histidine kinase